MVNKALSLTFYYLSADRQVKDLKIRSFSCAELVNSVLTSTNQKYSNKYFTFLFEFNIETSIISNATNFVRKEERTRGHVFVVMLAYMITKYISDKISHLDYTRKFAIESLDKIQYVEYLFKGRKINIRPKNLPLHTQKILKELDMTENVAKNKITVQVSLSLGNKGLRMNNHVLLKRKFRYNVKRCKFP